MRNFLFFILSILLVGCSQKKNPSTHDHLVANVFPDTLLVGTLYSPTSYFQYRDEVMGYDYALIQRLAQDKNIATEFTLASSMGSLIELLDSGYIDLIAYDVPVTSSFLEHIVPCGYEHLTSQLLVQKKGNEILTDVTQLIGREIAVEKGSKYHQRILNLDEELGGGIIIKEIDADTLITEDLLDLVVEGKCDFTVIDTDVARLNKAYYPGLDFSLKLSFPQKSSWGVAPRNAWLADSIDRWFASAAPVELNSLLFKRYFEISKSDPYSLHSFTKNFSKGYISDYDDLFRRHASTIDWDWRLLASMGYRESHFDTTVVSWAGARGLMQIMPKTARAYGLTDDLITSPDASISTAVKILQTLDRNFREAVPDSAERIKFILAAYNSGPAHIIDAISIAKATGKNPTLWDGNVSEALKMKSQPEIYNNTEICRFGYFKGGYTTAYVKGVLALYDQAAKSIPL